MTVEEFLIEKSHTKNKDIVMCSQYGGDFVTKRMIEFAQYHVEQALNAADGEVPLPYSHGVLNCYPSSNIK